MNYIRNFNNLKNERYINFKSILNNNIIIEEKKLSEKSAKIALNLNFKNENICDFKQILKILKILFNMF